MKKILASLAVLLLVALVPLTSVSKNNGPETLILTSDNLLVLNGEVTGESVGAIILKAKELDAKLSGIKEKLSDKRHLYLYLNSPGGQITAGLQLKEVLKGIGRPVDTITAFSASMAFQLAEGLDTRYILESGILMSHRAAGQFQGSFGGTSPSQLDSRVRLWTQITKEMDELVVKRTNGKQTLKSYQEAYSPELWITGQESVAQGYADAVVRVKCGDGLTGTSKHETQFLGLPIQFELDNCPLNTSPMNAKVVQIPGVSVEYMERVKAQFLIGYEMKAKTGLPMTF